MKPLISVIIPAHNEERYLGATLEAIRRQTYRYYESLVIANGCQDDTVAVARGQCDRVIELASRGLGKARNTGGAKARGELLLFVDADTRPDVNALEAIAGQFTPSYSSGTIPGRPDPAKLRYSLFYWYKNLLHRTKLHCGSSGVICCWRDQFKEVSGFDERLQVRENSHLIQRLRRFGPYRFIGGTAAVTSMRRYEKAGAARGAMEWLEIWVQSKVSDLHHRSYQVIR